MMIDARRPSLLRRPGCRALRTDPATLAAVPVLVQRWGMLAAALVALCTDPAGAQTPPTAPMARSGATMAVAVNKSQTLRVERAIGKAVIGNDKIADVLPTSLSSVYVLGKAVGATNLSLFDRAGNLIAVVDVVVSPDTQGLKRKLAELLPTEPIGVTVSNDAVILDGAVGSAAAAQRAMAIAETFAPEKVINMLSVGTPQQILLEVRFSEMSRGTVKQLGIRNLSFTGPSLSVNSIAPSSGPSNYSASFGFANLSFQLDALEQKGLVRTLAQPNLIALSGEPAYFLAGGEFPVPTGVTLNGQVTVEFKEFGVSLKFTPTLLEDGLINLVVAPEVSALDSAAGINFNGLQIPGLRTRRAKTTLELRDGQAFAMAGLIQSDFRDTVNAVPLLSKIPIIGALFRSTSFTKNESELVIIVTPRIVRPVAAGSVLALPSDRVVEPGDIDLFLNGRSERIVPLAPTGRLPGPPGGANTPTATAPTTASPAAASPTTPSPVADARPGGITGDIGHIVR